MLAAVPRQLRCAGWGAGRLSALFGRSSNSAASNTFAFSQIRNDSSDSSFNSATFTSTYQHDRNAAAETVFPKPKRWPKYNDVIHAPEEGPVTRYYNHYRANIRYSPKKMWYVAGFIRGMSIDEAIAQLKHVPQRKGAYIVKEILEEAREIAINEHNFEYRSKMWIAESFCTKGYVMKGLRKHARMRFNEIHYFHSHYYVKLVEGDPPKNYLPAQAPYTQLDTVEDKLNQYVDKLRKRRIDYAL